MENKAKHSPYSMPAGGWGSIKSVAKHAIKHQAVKSVPGLFKDHNKVGGYACTSCAWAKPAKPHFGEFCENGAKATYWDLTSKRTTPDFFAKHTLTELLTWADYDLENEGRLTHPVRYDALSDKYLEVSWAEAFADIGAKLKSYEPKTTIFYASGRASLETSYMYQLLARSYGNNNLPDSSNMCHETTSVAMPQSIGTPVGTVLLEDYEYTDCILSFGQNVGTNAPRLLHTLQEVRDRGAPIVVFNPLKERGWQAFVNPQRLGQMSTNNPTDIATQYYQVNAGGDIAAIMGMAKCLFMWDDEAITAKSGRVIDVEFIAEHTHGFAEFETYVRSTSWEDILATSGLSYSSIEAAARTYANARSVIAIYGMGLTQHRYGTSNIQMLINLLLMRGNIGRAGAGICPVRGHSNVQGQRTVGIAEKAELVPLDRLAEQYNFEPPREDGMNTVEVCGAIIRGDVKAFIGLGGNFARAVPERNLMEKSWHSLDLSVQIATKLNRSHLMTAATTYILPTLVRTEIDMQASGPQIVTMEDSTTCIHASRGKYQPASDTLLSEPRIVAEIAKNTLQPNPSISWDEWVDDYSKVRDAIEATFPDKFKDFNARLDTPGGFPLPVPARDRVWETDTGKANFKLPRAIDASFAVSDDPNILRLITLRSNDQFNTTIYGYDDRLRGIHKSRMIIMINADDRIRLGLEKDGYARITTAVNDGIERTITGMQLIDYDLPPGSCAAYFPECNSLIPLWQHDEESKTPAAKSVPVRIEPA